MARNSLPLLGHSDYSNSAVTSDQHSMWQLIGNLSIFTAMQCTSCWLKQNHCSLNVPLYWSANQPQEQYVLDQAIVQIAATFEQDLCKPKLTFIDVKFVEHYPWWPHPHWLQRSQQDIHCSDQASARNNNHKTFYLPTFVNYGSHFEALLLMLEDLGSNPIIGHFCRTFICCKLFKKRKWPILKSL